MTVLESKSPYTDMVKIQDLYLIEDIQDMNLLKKVKESVNQFGLLEPLAVAFVTPDEWHEFLNDSPECYEPPPNMEQILMVLKGNNRLRAAQQLGYTAISCNIFDSIAEAVEYGLTQYKRSKAWRVM